MQRSLPAFMELPFDLQCPAHGRSNYLINIRVVLCTCLKESNAKFISQRLALACRNRTFALVHIALVPDQHLTSQRSLGCLDKTSLKCLACSSKGTMDLAMMVHVHVCVSSTTSQVMCGLEASPASWPCL